LQIAEGKARDAAVLLVPLSDPEKLPTAHCSLTAKIIIDNFEFLKNNSCKNRAFVL
jgi:hypothetical protein